VAVAVAAGHIYTIPARGLGASDVRADPAGNLVTIFTSDLCNGNCGDTPGLVRVLAERTGTFYGTPMRAGHVYTVAGNDQEATVPRWTRPGTWCWPPISGCGWWPRGQAGSTASG
jgi:hypothetical protein